MNGMFFARIRKWWYKLAYLFVAIPAICISYELQRHGMMKPLIDNSVTLAVSGAAIAAFLFAIQSALISVPKENPFMRQVRENSQYLIVIHRFCRMSEIIFMLIMLPMFFMDETSELLNFLMTLAYICALLLTVWAMYLMGRILILSEKYSMR